MHVWKAKHQIVIVRKHSSSFSEDSLKYISQSNMLRMQQIIELETSYSSMKFILIIRMWEVRILFLGLQGLHYYYYYCYFLWHLPKSYP